MSKYKAPAHLDQETANRYRKEGYEYALDWHNSSKQPSISTNKSSFSKDSEKDLVELYMNRKGKNTEGVWKWLHYLEAYNCHFQRFVNKEVHILEIGVYSGGSLSLWREFFGNKCHVYGVDIEDCTQFSKNNTKIFVGDQADPQFWKRIREAVPKIDIIIDDGGHQSHQIISSLKEMLSHISPGGIYVIEDLQGTYNEGAQCFLQGLITELYYFNINSDYFKTTPDDAPNIQIWPQGLQRWIRSISIYPLLCIIEKNTKEKDLLDAPKVGGVWNPIAEKTKM